MRVCLFLESGRDFSRNRSCALFRARRVYIENLDIIAGAHVCDIATGCGGSAHVRTCNLRCYIRGGLLPRTYRYLPDNDAILPV